MAVIIADNTIPYLKGILEPIANISYLGSEQFTANAVKEADTLIVRSVDKCTREVLEGSRVKLITTATIGFDHIDTRYCDEAGIVWKNAPGCNAESVAEYLVSCLLTLSDRTGEPLSGKTIGIIGVGHVGQKVEKLCRVLGLNILRNDPPRAEKEGECGFVSLETIAEQADIITVHTPLTKEGKHPTYHLINEEFLSSLKKSPWLINAARGAIHDTNVLLEARRSGRISRLVLDCWESEPTIDRKLLSVTDIATPHIAGFSADGKANATRICMKEISRFFGLPITGIPTIKPQPPAHPIIDLPANEKNPVLRAVSTSFNPLEIDSRLRKEPERFEWFRANYRHPREFNAYTVSGGTNEEKKLLRSLGFHTEP